MFVYSSGKQKITVFIEVNVQILKKYSENIVFLLKSKKDRF